MSKFKRLFHLQARCFQIKPGAVYNVTENHKNQGDILKKKQQKEYWLPSMTDVTPSELGYMLYTSQKLSTLGSRLIIGEFWPIIYARL